MRRILLASWLMLLVATTVRGGEVSGVVTMPEVCAPEVSPAVVTLEPAGGESPRGPGGETRGMAGSAEVALINQRGLQFVPRVQAIVLGQTVRFTNEDTETHNIHVGNDFNESMGPGQPRSFTPTRPGVYTLLCDVHSHMRGHVVVADSPWVRVCTRKGRFRFEGVPAGRYVLNIWHEMGTPLRRPIEVAGGDAVDLGTLALSVPASSGGLTGASAPARPWARVIERIGLLLASSLDAAGRPDGLKAARKLAEDAYWGEFEASDMETAVRIHLGFARAGELEGQFRAMVAAVRDAAQGRQPAEHATAASRKLLLGLLEAADELNRKGVTDRSHVFGMTGVPQGAAPAPVAVLGDAERHRQLAELKRGFAGVRELADQGETDEAASAMTAVYFDQFEPIERYIAARKPQDVRPLEVRFNAIRGEVSNGLNGEPLAATLADLQTQVETALGRSEATRAGTFGAAFVASFITILREGAEVILLLAMLIALAAKTGQAGALRAIARGVALAVVASLGTAVGLNLLVASAQGRTRELVEGLVMLAAAGVLFYVSYWLISQSESRRWVEFLKRQARRGAELGGRGALALSAFLAVYREGAETALMYQALLGTQGQSRAGLIGLSAGLGVGLVALAVFALLVRATSVRLPLRAFFKISGAVLFGLAVVFAGNAIFELQQCGLLRTTTLAGPLAWLGQGIPLLGLYPNVQTLSVQGLLMLGAGLALVLMLPDRSGGESRIGPQPTAGVGI